MIKQEATKHKDVHGKNYYSQINSNIIKLRISRVQVINRSVTTRY